MSRKILVVDDAPEVVELIKAILEGQEYQVMTAANGVDALDKIRREAPVLIIADVLMPEMDGFIFFKELRKDSMTNMIPVIILTARAKMEDTFKTFGVDGFLSKPINADFLLSEVERLLQRKPQPPAEPAPEAAPSLFEEMATGEAAPTDGRTENDLPAVENRPYQTLGDENAANKVLIFGLDTKVLAEMSEQLVNNGCYVVTVMNERQIIPQMEVLWPTIILVQLETSTAVPVDEIIGAMVSMINHKKDELTAGQDPDAPTQHMGEIVLYKLGEEVTGEMSMGAELADMESLLTRCYENGATSYIGIFSSISFIVKIEEFFN